MLDHVDVLTVQISKILSVKHKTTDSDDIRGEGGRLDPSRFLFVERGLERARGVGSKGLGSSLGGEGEGGVIEIKLFKIRTNQKTGKLDFDRQPIK